MRTCAAISLSGGQGKTTVVFFLGLLMAAQGHRVLLVDADPQSNLTFYLGQELQPTQPTLLEVITAHVTPEDGIYPTRYPNLFVIPADRGLFKVNDFLASSGAGAFILKLRLQAVAKLFDYCLIDVQPSRSQLCLTATGAAEFVVIPAEANVKGTNSLLDTLDFLNEQRQITAFSGRILGVLPFRDRWTGKSQALESRQNIEAMQQLAEGVSILPSIRESEQFKRAIRQGCLLTELGYPDLQYPFEKLLEALNA